MWLDIFNVVVYPFRVADQQFLIYAPYIAFGRAPSFIDFHNVYTTDVKCHWSTVFITIRWNIKQKFDKKFFLKKLNLKTDYTLCQTCEKDPYNFKDDAKNDIIVSDILFFILLFKKINNLLFGKYKPKQICKNAYDR